MKKSYAERSLETLSSMVCTSQSQQIGLAQIEERLSITKRFE